MKRTTETVKEIESPSGLDLHPQPPSPVRLSKRAGILVLVVVFAVAALVGYGIVTRGNRSFQTGFHPDDAKGLTAATDAGKVIAAQIPNRAGIVGGSADRQPAQAEELRPPGQALSLRRRSQRSADVRTCLVPAPAEHAAISRTDTGRKAIGPGL